MILQHSLWLIERRSGGDCFEIFANRLTHTTYTSMECEGGRGEVQSLIVHFMCTTIADNIVRQDNVITYCY